MHALAMLHGFAPQIEVTEIISGIVELLWPGCTEIFWSNIKVGRVDPDLLDDGNNRTLHQPLGNKALDKFIGYD